MRLMMACAAAVLATATLTTGTAMAQTVPPVASARQLELTRQYLQLTMSSQFDSAIREMIVDQIAADPTARDIPEADRRFLSDLTAELTTDMIPQMLEQMAPVYARTFTEAELEALIAFFGSEMGRSITEKTMLAMPEANREAMTVLPQLMEKLGARICEHYGCTAEEMQEMRRQMNGSAAPAPARRK